MAKKTKSEPEFITGSELARRLGVSETAVRKAVESGRISPAYTDKKGRRWFVEETVRKQWGRNTLPEKSMGRQSVTSTVSVTAPDINTGVMPNPTEARAMKDMAHTRILTFKAKTLEQELVGAEDVVRLWEKHVADAKRLFLPCRPNCACSSPH